MQIRSRHASDQRGFTIIEMSVALAVFSLLSVLFASQLVTNYRVYGKAKERTTAEEIASRIIERARELDYGDVGIVGGTPPGTIPASSTETVNGLTYTVTNTVALVDDPVPGSLSASANYKRLRVVVSSGGAVLSDLITVVSSPEKAVASNAVMRVMVADYILNKPLVGATVNVSGVGSPQSRLTDAAGRVEFAGLAPTNSVANEHYSLTAALAGYQLFPTDVPPSPAVHTTFGPTQVFDTTIRLFKTVSITIRLVNPDGTPYTPSTYVWFQSSQGGQNLLVTGGEMTITSMAPAGGAPQPIYPLARYGVWWAVSYDSAWNQTGLGDNRDYRSQIASPSYPLGLNTAYEIRMNPVAPPAPTTTAATTTTVSGGGGGPGSTVPPTTAAPTTTTTTIPASTTTTTTQPVGM